MFMVYKLCPEILHLNSNRLMVSLATHLLKIAMID